MMVNSLLSKVVKTKVFTFCVQIIALNLLIYSFNYHFIIDFNEEITLERRYIIQFLGNMIAFTEIRGMVLIALSWTLIGIFPVIIFRKYQKIIYMNILTLFIPSFFFYVFLSKYSQNYFILNFPILFVNTILLGIVLLLTSGPLGHLRIKLSKSQKGDQKKDLEKISKKNQIVCPECGTIFESKPTYCYKCSKKLIPERETNQKKR
jgi:DNA-directed RNA polymerase subunit RPC12/RpoP